MTTTLTTTAARHPAARVAATALTLAAALLLGACDSADDDTDGVASAGDPSPPADDGAAAPDEAGEGDLLAFASCMRDNGIDLPDPTGSDEEGLVDAYAEVMDDYTTEELQAATETCRDLVPPQEGRMREELDADTRLELAECLREQGIDVGDDLFAGGLPEDVDRADVMDAMDVCREVLE